MYAKFVLTICYGMLSVRSKGSAFVNFDNLGFKLRTKLKLNKYLLFCSNGHESNLNHFISFFNKGKRRH